MTTRAKPKPMRPIEARTVNAVCALKMDGSEAGDYWLMINPWGNQVTIAHQKKGEKTQAEITLPRRYFDALVRWYVTGSKTGAITPPQKPGRKGGMK